MSDLKVESQNKTNTFQRDVGEIFQITDQSKDFYSILDNGDNSNVTLAMVLKCYYQSAKFYELYGRISSAVFEYRKILQTIMLVASGRPNDNKVDLLIDILKTDVVDVVLQLTSSVSERTDRHMILKVERGMQKVDAETKAKWPIDFSIANCSEAKEIQLIFEYIKLKVEYYNGERKIAIDSFIKSHASLSTQYLRITELDFYCRYLYKEMKLYIAPTGILQSDFEALRQNLLEFLYSKNKIIRTLKIYESDYTFGPGFLAYMHFSIAQILSKNILDSTDEQIKTLADLIFAEDAKEANPAHKFDYQLKNLLGDRSLVLFDARYHYGIARDNYKHAIALHTAGAEYRKQIKNMIYLEDDFNDNAYHYGAAYERYLMINDFFENQLKFIDNKLDA